MGRPGPRLAVAAPAHDKRSIGALSQLVDGLGEQTTDSLEENSDSGSYEPSPIKRRNAFQNGGGDHSIVYKGEDSVKIEFFRRDKTVLDDVNESAASSELASEAASQSMCSVSPTKVLHPNQSALADVSAIPWSRPANSMMSARSTRSGRLSPTIFSASSDESDMGAEESSPVNVLTAAARVLAKTARTPSAARSPSINASHQDGLDSTHRVTLPSLSTDSLFDEDAADDDDDDAAIGAIISRASRLHDVIAADASSARKAPAAAAEPSDDLMNADAVDADEAMQLRALESAVQRLTKEVYAAQLSEEQTLREAQRQEIEALRLQLEAARADADARRQSKALRIEEMSALKDNVRSLQAEVKRAQLEALNRELSTKQTLIGSIEGMQGDVRSVLANTQASMARLEAQIADVSAAKEREKLELAIEKATLAAQKAELETALAAVTQTSAAEADAFRAVARELDARNRNLERQRLDVEADLTRQMGELLAQRAGFEAEVAMLSQRLAEGEDKFNADRARLAGEAAVLRAELADMARVAEAAEADAEAAAADANTAHEGLEALQTENEALRAKLVAEIDDREREHSEATRLHRELGELRASLAASEARVREQIEAMEGEIARVEALAAAREAELIAMREERESEVLALETRIIDLERELLSQRLRERADGEEIQHLLGVLEEQQAADLAERMQLEAESKAREAASAAEVADARARGAATLVTVASTLSDWQVEAAELSIQEAMAKAQRDFKIQQREEQIAELRDDLRGIRRRARAERAVIEGGMRELKSKLMAYAVEAEAREAAEERARAELEAEKSRRRDEVGKVRKVLAKIRRRSMALERGVGGYGSPARGQQQMLPQPSSPMQVPSQMQQGPQLVRMGLVGMSQMISSPLRIKTQQQTQPQSPAEAIKAAYMKEAAAAAAAAAGPQFSAATRENAIRGVGAEGRTMMSKALPQPTQIRTHQMQPMAMMQASFAR